MTIVNVCRFQRTSTSNFEWGVEINESIILDRDGVVVPEVYNTKSFFHRGSFVLPNEEDF